MTTKDERPERLPMIIDALVRDDGHPSLMSAEQVRDFYEDKITKGELMVAKTARLVGSYGSALIKCSNCHLEYVTGECGDMYPDVGQFCFCGARIIE